MLTSDNPRYEDPLDILSEIERGYRRFSVKYVVVPDREKAIDYALNLLKRATCCWLQAKAAKNIKKLWV